MFFYTSYYCFNLSFSGYFFLGISGNCSDENGMPYRTYISIETTSFKIDHKRKYPFQKLERNKDNLISRNLQLITSKNSYYFDVAKFTIVSYESDKIFRKGKDDEVMAAYIEVYDRIIPDDEKVI